jgi:ectoine hydroxylase-related dioxygenase (phytanoyl-CoA dioxygenase family)
MSVSLDEAAEILAGLGVTEQCLTDDERAQLDREGFVVLDGIVGAASVGAMRAVIDTLLEQARRDVTKRTGGTLHLDNLLDSGPAFDAVWTSPRLLAAIAHVLGPAFRADAVTYRGPQPGYGAQALHTDDVALGADNAYTTATAIVALVDFTPANGATRIVPGSHREPLRDAPTDTERAHPRQRTICMSAGAALVFNGHLWHSGQRNTSDARRDALQIVFRRRAARAAYAGPNVSNATVDRLGTAALLLL